MRGSIVDASVDQFIRQCLTADPHLLLAWRKRSGL